MVTKILRRDNITLKLNKSILCRGGGIGRRRGLKILCTTEDRFVMVTKERNQMIRDIFRAYPYWSYQKIADLVGVSRQRVQQILKSCNNSAIMSNMETEVKLNIGTEPISATQAAKLANIPYAAISMWVKRGFVKVVSRPEHATWGKPVLLDPVSLQERINQYKPRKKIAA